MPLERRCVVDRRRGAERRSTLDRRSLRTRRHAAESPGEHVRNALQVLAPLSRSEELQAEQRTMVNSALRRLQLALALLEHR